MIEDNKDLTVWAVEYICEDENCINLETKKRNFELFTKFKDPIMKLPEKMECTVCGGPAEKGVPRIARKK